jgi:hypothetical protein
MWVNVFIAVKSGHASLASIGPGLDRIGQIVLWAAG